MKINMNLNVEDIELFSSDDEQAIIKALYPATQKLLNILLENAEIDFPFRFGSNTDGYSGPKVDDPMTLYIVRDNGYDFEVMAKLSFMQLINESLNDVETCRERKKEWNAISSGLKKLAEKIDSVFDAK